LPDYSLGIDRETELIILTDNREEAAPILTDLAPVCDSSSLSAGLRDSAFVEKWRDISSSQLTPAEQLLWAGLSGSAQLSRCEINAKPELNGWDCLVIIDEAIGSQFDALRDLDPAKLPGSVACIASVGSGFHGHHSRSWQTQRGNLHLSTICDPDLDAVTCGLAMTTLPAVALIDTLLLQGPWVDTPGIKWVNDILIADCKVAGVLTATQSYRGRLTGLTLGLGVNVETTPSVSPTPFVPQAGSLAGFTAGGEKSTVGSVLSGCLIAIWRRLESVRQQGPAELIQAYRDHSLILGRRVVIWPDSSSLGDQTLNPTEPLAVGVVTDIGPDLSLTLDGHSEAIRCGRLAFLPE
jgi:biotin-(acetyl-CoA carboxylase) ligase